MSNSTILCCFFFNIVPILIFFFNIPYTIQPLTILVQPSTPLINFRVNVIFPCIMFFFFKIAHVLKIFPTSSLYYSSVCYFDPFFFQDEDTKNEFKKIAYFCFFQDEGSKNEFQKNSERH